VDIDDIGLWIEMQVPDVFEQLHAGQKVAVVAGEEDKQIELAWTERDVGLIDMHSAGLDPDLQWAKDHQVVVGAG